MCQAVGIRHILEALKHLRRVQYGGRASGIWNLRLASTNHAITLYGLHLLSHQSQFCFLLKRWRQTKICCSFQKTIAQQPMWLAVGCRGLKLCQILSMLKAVKRLRRVSHEGRTSLCLHAEYDCGVKNYPQEPVYILPHTPITPLLYIKRSREMAHVPFFKKCLDSLYVVWFAVGDLK